MSTRAASLRRVLSAIVIALAAVAASAPVSYAQDPFADFFGGLFGGGSHHSRSGSDEERSPRMRRIMPHQERRSPTYWRSGENRGSRRATRRTDAPSGETPADQTTADQAAASVKPDFYVAVMGDTLGILLANGLQDGLADKPSIAVLRKGKESSGLVRDDFYDWPKAAKEIASGPQKIDVAVIMIGSNDRQTLRTGTESIEPLTDRFREIYAARVDAVLAAFKEKKIPVVWVGLPVMKNEHFSADMAKLNEIYKERAAHAGAAFVDIWEATADEKGQYSAFGPDINGQIVKLRSADGVHFTEAGARSVAHFVAAEVKKLYDAHRPAAPAPGQPAAALVPTNAQTAAPASAAPPAVPGQPLVFRSPVASPYVAAPPLPDRPAVGPEQPLAAVAPAAGNELARRGNAPIGADPAQALAKHVFVDGGDQTPRPNRADDFSWKH
jgi:hypothetical protein